MNKNYRIFLVWAEYKGIKSLWIENVRNSCLGMEFAFNLAKNNPDRLISGLFDWMKTKQNIGYWYDLDKKWIKFFEAHKSKSAKQVEAMLSRRKTIREILTLAKEENMDLTNVNLTRVKSEFLESLLLELRCAEFY